MHRIIRTSVVAAALAALFASLLQAAPARKPQAAAGPTVVSTEPRNKDKAVDPGVNTLKITFSMPMKPDEFYVGPIDVRDLPEWAGQPALSPDGLTFTVPMTLRPGRKYGIAINAPGHMKFQSTDGKAARPYQIFFNTAETTALPAAPLAPTTPATPAAGGAPAAAPAGGFHLLTPANGDEIRDRVAVTIPTTAIPDGNFVTFFVDDRFIIGMAPDRSKPALRFDWDTKEPLPGREPLDARVPKDGPHKLRVELHDAGGEMTQREEVTVNLKNAIDAAELQNVPLQYKFATGKDLEYNQHFECQVDMGAGNKIKHRGDVTTQILFEEKQDDGSFALMGRYVRGRVDDVDANGKEIATAFGGVNPLVRFEFRPNGALRMTSREGKPPFDPIYMLLPLPPNAVKIGDQWSSDLMLPDVQKSKTALAKAQHTIEGVEWQGGQETVRIRSDYTLTGIKDPDATRYLIMATGYTMMPPGTTMEIQGRRYTYFAYKLGRVMRVAERKRIRLVIPILQNQGGMGSGSGSPGYPGMGGSSPGMPGPYGVSGPVGVAGPSRYPMQYNRGGGYPGSGSSPGYPGSGYPGSGGSPGYPGSGYPGSGGSPGYPGSGYPGSGMPGAGMAPQQPTKVIYNIEASEITELAPPEENQG